MQASMATTATNTKGRLVLLWLLVNSILLTVAAGIWAWAEYRYLKLYRPPEEIRTISEYILHLLPITALAANLFILRRLCLWRHLVWSFVSALIVTAAWWGLFQTLGVQWHLSMGGTLN